MIPVHEAEEIIAQSVKNYGIETVHFEQASGRVLAEGICCDRDFPPFNRVSMDGIAIRYEAFEAGLRKFTVKGTQPAGDAPIEITDNSECVEIMTGAALPGSVDTVIRYEDLIIDGSNATLLINTLKKGQSIHYKGQDKKQGSIAVPAGTLIGPAVISVAATVGQTQLLVKKLPRVAILSTGDELVDIHEIPSAYEIRRSNGYTIKQVLKPYGIDATLTHLPDKPEVIESQITNCLANFDILLLSGGVSMGKYDHLPAIFEKLGIKQRFHKVQQRPGKPFWFGGHENGTLVFAFPGNPVSAFLCMHRYFIPWLEASLGIKSHKLYASLTEDITFAPPLQYFMQVRAEVNEQGKLIATPVHGNGSGDLANLIETNSFMELPAERNHFLKGEVFRVWPFKNIL